MIGKRRPCFPRMRTSPQRLKSPTPAMNVRGCRSMRMRHSDAVASSSSLWVSCLGTAVVVFQVLDISLFIQVRPTQSDVVLPLVMKGACYMCSKRRRYRKLTRCKLPTTTMSTTSSVHKLQSKTEHTMYFIMSITRTEFLG